MFMHFLLFGVIWAILSDVFLKPYADQHGWSKAKYYVIDSLIFMLIFMLFEQQGYYYFY